MFSPKNVPAQFVKVRAAGAQTSSSAWWKKVNNDIEQTINEKFVSVSVVQMYVSSDFWPPQYS